MAWQGNGMDAAWERHAMCESTFNVQIARLVHEVLECYDRAKRILTALHSVE